MRIALYNPSVYWYSLIQYRMFPSLALPILAAVLRKAGHEVEVTDLEVLGVTPERLRAGFEQQRDRWPDVVGFTAVTMAQAGAKAAISAIRDAGFRGLIVVGGVHVTIHPQEGLDWGADLVVKGECEGNITALLESGVTGIHAGRAAPIEDIPMPAWDYHNPAVTSYQANLAMLRPMPGTSQWTRGCPYQCLFCGNVVFGHQPTRYRPVANVIAEMTDLAERGAKHCYVYDDELVGTKLPPNWMRDIADGIAHLGIKWLTLARCSKKFITHELLSDMKRAGCFYIFWGVESFSQKVLDLMRKHITPDDIMHTLRVARDVGIKSGVLTMVGNYGETEEDLAITRDGLAQAYAEGLIPYRQTNVCLPMPGTRLYDLAVDEGWYEEPDDQGVQMLKVHHGTPWVSGERLNHWLDEFDRVCPKGEFGQP